MPWTSRLTTCGVGAPEVVGLAPGAAGGACQATPRIGDCWPVPAAWRATTTAGPPGRGLRTPVTPFGTRGDICAPVCAGSGLRSPVGPPGERMAGGFQATSPGIPARLSEGTWTGWTGVAFGGEAAAWASALKPSAGLIPLTTGVVAVLPRTPATAAAIIATEEGSTVGLAPLPCSSAVSEVGLTPASTTASASPGATAALDSLPSTNAGRWLSSFVRSNDGTWGDVSLMDSTPSGIVVAEDTGAG
mmetsp:Transcript_113591/g.244572  ORF Transcript_113591/g.244572 Transcript_113591/m.244572 type:complete len:246 (+) Transcript_113591:620-1357(+)